MIYTRAFNRVLLIDSQITAKSLRPLLDLLRLGFGLTELILHNCQVEESVYSRLFLTSCPDSLCLGIKEDPTYAATTHKDLIPKPRWKLGNSIRRLEMHLPLHPASTIISLLLFSLLITPSLIH